MTSIAVVSAVYNQAWQLSLLLRMLGKQSRLPDQVIIADDGSKDDIRSVLAAAPLRDRTFWVHQENRGFRKNRILNAALRACTCDLVIFTDADCIPHHRFVADHAALLTPGTIVQGARGHVNADWADRVGNSDFRHFYGLCKGHLRGWRSSVRWPLAGVRVSNSLEGTIGCNMSFWRSQLLAINGFDEEYQGWGYGEDFDPSARVQISGARKLITKSRAVTYHIDHPLTSRASADANLRRYRDVIARGATWCVKGANSYDSSEGEIRLERFL